MREPGGLPFDPQSLAVWLRTLPPVGQYRNEQTGEFGWWFPASVGKQLARMLESIPHDGDAATV